MSIGIRLKVRENVVFMFQKRYQIPQVFIIGVRINKRGWYLLTIKISAKETLLRMINISD